MNSFQKFYEQEIINEVPHGLVGDEPIDFKMEKPGWEFKMYDLLRRTPKESIGQLLRPFYDLGYKRILKRKFEQLDIEKKQMLLKVLPTQFIQDMKLSESIDNKEEVITEAGKYDHIDFVPPEGVAKAAEKGLEFRKKAGGKGGLSSKQAKAEGIGSGVQRAVNLKNRNKISPDTVKRMKAFFDRHEKNASIDSKYKGEPWKDRGYVAWLCVTGDTEITLSDGSSKQIKDIVDNKLNLEILTFNEKTKMVEPKKIIGWFKQNSTIDDFLVIKKNKCNRSDISKKTKLNITKEHPVYSNGGWIQVKNLKSNNNLYQITLGLNEISEQVLLGSLLGDGCITSTSKYGSRYQERHCIQQEEYLLQKKDLLEELKCRISYNISKTGYGKNKQYVNLCTKQTIFLNKYKKMLYQNNKKVVNIDLLNRLNWLGIYFWFCDDGSLHWGKDHKYQYYRLHTEGYDIDSINTIILFFESRGLYCKKYKRENCEGYCLYFDKISSEIISKNISIYSVECMKYKLLDIHKNNNEIILFKNINYSISEDNFDIIFKPSEYKSESLKKNYKWKYRYNIEVEDNNNYFANGWLVHNCWGGNAGRSWANKIVKQMESADKKGK